QVVKEDISGPFGEFFGHGFLVLVQATGFEDLFTFEHEDTQKRYGRGESLIAAHFAQVLGLKSNFIGAGELVDEKLVEPVNWPHGLGEMQALFLVAQADKQRVASGTWGNRP